MRYSRILFFSGLIAILLTLSIHSQENNEKFNHQIYDSLLKKQVDKQGLVNYRLIKKTRSLLDSYLNSIKNVDPQAFENWSKNEKMAFWINAYNAITIDGIVRNYPIEYGGIMVRVRFPKNSIRQINDFWDTVFIKVMGKDLTLNDIEHEILREKFRDPRIHAVLVCAALGCPNLENSAFTAIHLDEQLDRANIKFINNPDKVRIDEQKNKLYLSSILNWYKEDFIPSSEGNEIFKSYNQNIRGVVEFVVKYLPGEKADYVKKNKPKIEFLDYDWTLNEQS
jgi:hypothetical protein